MTESVDFLTYRYPDENGRFGPYGGRFVPETLMPALEELEQAYLQARNDSTFQAELQRLFLTYVGRPTPITHARRLSEQLGGAQIYLKREDLAHSGAHKINNALGQALLVKRMGKRRIVAETGAGQHGVATATVAALLGIECVVYMGTVDMARQAPNVFRMKLLGAEVRGVDSGSKTLKDAINEAIRDWVTNVGDTHYLLGSALGPHPYPTIVRDFQSVIGREARRQMLDPAAGGPGRLPDAIVACVGGGSNAIGIFHPFLADTQVRLIGVEAGGRGIESGEHAARFADPALARLGVLHGTKSFVMQDADGQIALTHSVSAGLDYAVGRPGARPAARPGPQRVHLRHRRRGAGRLQAAVRDRGHHPRPGKRPRRRASGQAGAGAGQGRGDPGQPQRAWRQGSGHGDEDNRVTLMGLAGFAVPTIIQRG